MDSEILQAANLLSKDLNRIATALERISMSLARLQEQQVKGRDLFFGDLRLLRRIVNHAD